jgi:hypothetical protein
MSAEYDVAFNTAQDAYLSNALNAAVRFSGMVESRLMFS